MMKMSYGKIIDYTWNSVLDISAFAVSGYFAGEFVNQFTKWTTVSSFFAKPPQIDLAGAIVCCALFATIDRLAYLIFSTLTGRDNANKPINSIFRIGIGATLALNMTNALTSHYKLGQIDTNLGMSVILIAIVINNIILFNLNQFNARYESRVK
jgi:hypothetical protein